MTRAFSGVQPSGRLHIGNYFGALRHFVPLQEEYEAFYCVVDLHAITVPQEAEALQAASRRTIAAFLAAGLRPERATLFVQSAVSAHAELAWLLNCVARLGWLERMTQFKDKAPANRERASAGLYVYPVLMAADVLAYRAERVPVGEDQKQHLELVRDVADKFNRDWCGGETFFPLPEALIAGGAARIMSLRDGTRKMSKSDASDAGCIYLDDDADSIRRKLRRAKSDSDALPDGALLEESGRGPTAAARARRPEAWNLLEIWHAASGESWAESCARFGGSGFAALKEALTDVLVERLTPLGREIERLVGEADALTRIMQEGAARAEAVSAPVVDEARRRMGLSVRRAVL